MIIDVASFHSVEFAPVLPEDSQVNHGRYGAELAFWLCITLFRYHKIATSYPQQEDWGWRLNYSSHNGVKYAIHCGNVDGASDLWLISIRRLSLSLFTKVRFDEHANVKYLVSALHKILATHNSITRLDFRCRL